MELANMTKVHNRLNEAFDRNSDPLLNVYFTAGYPQLEDTVRIARSLEVGGADILEIGLPFSDPIADGPTIQESSNKALDNGMSLKLLMQQLEGLRDQVNVPVLLMGYLNPVLQYGFEAFCQKCQEVGVDGLILPDLPMYEYQETYGPIMARYGLHNIFLITPQTSEQRILEVDDFSSSFIYVVSSYSTTGAKAGLATEQIEYFKRVNDLGLKSPLMIGFGISDHETFKAASDHASGAIIGSAFIKTLKVDASNESIKAFVKNIKLGSS